MRTPIFLALALAGCGSSSLADGTYTATFVNLIATCPATDQCPDLEHGTGTWTVSGGGTTLNTGKEAVTLTPNATQVGFTQTSSAYDSAAGCNETADTTVTLTAGPSPVQGTLRVSITGCVTCECTYKLTMTKQ